MQPVLTGRPNVHSRGIGGAGLLWALTTCVLATGLEPVVGADKYGPDAVPLSKDRGSLVERPSPDFWALMPFYAGQPNDQSCGLATAAMLLNGLRGSAGLTADAPLVTADELAARLAPGIWGRAFTADGPGVGLEQFEAFLADAARAYDLPTPQVERIPIERADEATRAQVRRLLEANEQSADDLLAVNFLQSTLTGDPEGAVGHLAPLAAYDAARDRALVLDPDRRWYEPYWVPVDKLVEALAARDPAKGRPRGLVRVRRRGGP